MAQVAICLVTHNNAADIGPALDAALAQTGVEAQVHVWDNAGRDATREIVKQRDKVVLHESEINHGFSGGCNRLLALVDAPFVLFLNPDTQLAPDCTSILLQTLQDAEANVIGVGPKLLKPGDPPRIDSTGIALSKHNLSPHDRGQHEPDRGQYDQPGPSFGPSLACALFRREALNALALDGQVLDETFFAYYEDVDLAWRAQRLGRRFLYQPRAVCRHRRSNPQVHGPTLFARAFVNRYLLLIANEDGRDGWGYLAWLLPRELLRMIWKTLTVKGFGIAWRMLRDDWRGARAKRRKLALMAENVR